MELKFNADGSMALVNGVPYYIRDGVVWRNDRHFYDGYRRKAYDQYEIVGRHYPCHFKDKAEARRFLKEAAQVFESWCMGKRFGAF